MRYKVRPWENYVVTYPGSNLAKHIFHSGSIVDIEDRDRDPQDHKLIELSDEEVAELDKPVVSESPAKPEEGAPEAQTPVTPKADREALKEQLRSGKKAENK